MAYNLYTDPQRAARQAAQQASDAARQASKRSMDLASQAAAKQVRDNQQRMFQQASDRARDDFNRRLREPAGRQRSASAGDDANRAVQGGRKRGGVLGFIIVLALIALGAKLLGFF